MRLEITTNIGCPVNCKDCPQALLRERYKGKTMMDFEEYKKAIDKVPKECRIDFSGMCEPFCNPRCTDMILYAKDHPLALYTTLQGATMEDYERLRGIPFEVITIHLPDCEGRSHFKITDEYLEVLANFPCHNYSVHGQMDDRVRPFLRQRNLITFMHDRAGNVEDRQHVHIIPERRLKCMTSGRAMDHNVLLPDGTVLMCCMDYGMTGVFGNLFEQSYEEVIHSPAAEEMRATLIRGESICRHCANAI